MIIEYTKNGYKYKRENWREYFKIYIFQSVLNDSEFKIPRFFYPVQQCWDRDGRDYWIFPLNYIVRAYGWLKRKWYKPARWLYEKGYLKKPESQPVSWFWFKYIRFKKDDKRRNT